MKTELFLFTLCSCLCAGCGDVEEPSETADASDTDTDTDTDTEGDCDGGSSDDCSAPWGWHDETSGLCWEQPQDETRMTWYDAKALCEERSTGGHCDWRLPTISELRSAVRGCEATMTGGSCGVTDECTQIFDCWDEESCETHCDLGGPGTDGCLWDSEIIGDCESECIWFWSSTNDGSIDTWMINYFDGRIDFCEADGEAARPWCVRTGV